ncbi:hypothetical protein Acr_01g0000230 [Actinidia rufa]|uniref:Uncharacterized protein n=1 Tax=Actinidia rufa TaxID=165716 RepID=A0A7J0E127_9ERIC|nr:hypothetical protein Acr_01g0000230 [Actinidia rufa]
MSKQSPDIYRLQREVRERKRRNGFVAAIAGIGCVRVVFNTLKTQNTSLSIAVTDYRLKDLKWHQERNKRVLQNSKCNVSMVVQNIVDQVSFRLRRCPPLAMLC